MTEVLLLWGFGTAMAASEPVLITQVRLVDARGDHGVHDVWLEKGRIAGIDPQTVPSEAERLDGEGLTLLPGLIDSHVHITQHPVGAWLEHSEALDRERQARYLRSYLAWGVTTVLDPGITTSDVQQIRALVDEVGGPDIQILGPLLCPQDGYPSDIFPELTGVSTPTEVRAQLDAFQDLDPIGIKVTMEDGPLRSIWPLFSDEMRQVIQTEAAARDLPIYVHAMDPKMTRKALEMAPHGLVHAPQTGGRALARQIAASDAYVIATLDIFGGVEWMDPDLDAARTRAWFQQGLGQDQWQLITDPEIMDRTWEAGLEVFAPGMSPRRRARLIPLLKRMVPGRIDKALKTTGRLHAAGVPLVVGSDAGGSPIIPYLVHGPSTHMEIALLGRAGLSPLEVIRAATLTPAEMMGLDHEIGTIEVGKRADLIVVDGDPLTNLNALANPKWVVREGDLRTPEAWLSEDGR